MIIFCKSTFTYYYYYYYY